MSQLGHTVGGSTPQAVHERIQWVGEYACGRHGVPHRVQWAPEREDDAIVQMDADLSLTPE